MPQIKLFAIFTLLIAFSARAVEVEVKVFEKAANAMEARTNALSDAEKRGFAALVKQKAPERAKQILKDYKGYNISKYILGYHAKEEVVTDTSYRAKIILDFDDRFVSNVIEQQASTAQYIGASQPIARSSYQPNQMTGNAILLLPVYRNALGVSLWEDRNLWREHINAMILEHGQGKFVAAYGDPTDKLSISASNVNTANFARLSPLAQRYGANRILIAILSERGKNGYSLSLREVSPTGDSIKIEHIESKDGVTSGNLMHLAAENLISGYLKKQHELANPQQAISSKVHKLEARISLNKARDWNNLRARMQRIDSIQEMHVLGADASGMTLHLAFKGDAQTFGKSLIDNGISATKQNDKLWLSLR